MVAAPAAAAAHLYHHYEQPQHIHPTSDAFVNSLIQELKTIKLNNNNNSSGGLISMAAGQNASITSNPPPKSLWSKQSSLWGGQQQQQQPPFPLISSNSSSISTVQSNSPTSSIKTQYHSVSSHNSASKESLWQSTQSSPNSNNGNRNEHNLQTASSSASSISSNQSLWESGANQKATSHSSYGSIWGVPSPPPLSPPSIGSKLSNLWEVDAVAPPCKVNYAKQSTTTIPLDYNGTSSSAAARLIRPHDISMGGGGGGGNGNVWSSSTLPKTKEPVGSLWANPTPPSSSTTNYVVSNKNSTAIKYKATNKRSTPPPPAPAQQQSPLAQLNITSTTTSASSSCLQLFSDEFLNYLNMIN